MRRKTIVVSINAAWNIFNFRRELLLALVAEGYRVVALAPEDSFSRRLIEMGIEFAPIPIDNQGISPFKDILLLARYRAALKRLRADLFLGYTIKPNIYGSIAAHNLGIPVINNISGLGTAFIRQGLLTRIVTDLYRLALRRSATVFFQNRDDRDLFLGKRIVRPEQSALLPGSGIDLERFSPPPASDRTASPFVFLYLGRLLWDKGLREFVEAARIVRAQHPSTIVRLLGFVDVPNRTAVARSDIEAWTGEGLIEYLPASDDVRPHIAQADCIVLPSYREGLPRALLEGAAMGRPLIATEGPGCGDVV
jgi:glycosyltransferase involved in cell wall biosynthesis